MSLDFLQKLERAQLPLRVVDDEALRCVEELLAARLIEGGVGTSAMDRRRMGIVRRITALGRAHLAVSRRATMPPSRPGDPA